MRIQAAVLYGTGEPLRVEELSLGEPQAGEVLVRLAASGVCHSDYHTVTGQVPLPLPIVLGHEGAGVVEAVGPNVTSVHPGDHVILSWVAACGRCRLCLEGHSNICATAMAGDDSLMMDGTTRLSARGQPIHHKARLATFADHAVVPEAATIQIRRDAPLDLAALVGCGVMTGVGAAIRTAKVAVGSTCVVIGCGGVGLNVIQGCALAGAKRIIGVDTHAAKEELARIFGATDFVDAATVNAVDAVRSLTDGGCDYAFEVVGAARTTEQALEMTRPSGTAVVVGVPAQNARASIDINFLMDGRTLTGTVYGSANLRVDIPMMVDLYMAGRLKLAELVTARRPLAEINEAFRDLVEGDGARTIILF
jgi:S-(hydroxymethyl)glutathione dehydrogenase/alcohol dehydrogenase